MKFVTFKNPSKEQRAGLLVKTGIIDLHVASEGKLPNNMLDFIKGNETYKSFMKDLSIAHQKPTYSFEEVKLIAPLPNPPSLRDFMAFEEHVANGRRHRGRDVPEQWYNIPVFYFSNHQAIVGPEAEVARPGMSKALDFELEVACIIGKEGKNIKAADAEEYIFGYTILNDFSARDLQMQEMSVGLGPAKGKDFATAIGPYIVTKEKIEQYKEDKGFNLRMTARINGEQYTDGNWKDIYYSFGEMIERASDGVTLYPGDLLGSGTVGLGCILELPEKEQRWLQPKDTIELEVEQLGTLRNYIV